MSHRKEQRMVLRDLSWLDFNARVLQEAADSKVPLLMRLKFLGIFSNNLDEFFRVRVAALRRLASVKLNGSKLSTHSRRTLKNIHQTVVEQQQSFEAIYANILLALQDHQIFVVDEKQLTDEQGDIVRAYFHDIVRPLLVPLMLSRTTKVPPLTDGSIYLALRLTDKKQRHISLQYALIELPTEKLPRFFVFHQDDCQYVILLDDVVRYCLADIFNLFGYNEFEAYTVKATKDAEMDLAEDVSKSFMEQISQGIQNRKFGQMTRFIYDKKIDKDLLKFLTQKLKIRKSDNIIPAGRYHNFKDFMNFPSLGKPHLDKRSNPPLVHPDINPRRSFLQLLRQKDVMLHFPYHSFHPIIDFLREAAIDPDVKFIKMTIYRLARQSDVMNALINARKNGKEVTAIVELQARFDEEANIEWTNQLQENGIKVLHGQQGIKIHAKLILIGRQENKKTRLYANISTGNFHEKTARTYADDSLFTSHSQLVKDVERVFDWIETRKMPQFRHLLVSPNHLYRKVLQLIDREIKLAKAGKPAYLLFKLNSLNEAHLIEKLYEASAAGVIIDLIVRGICSIIPQIPKLSENINAISIVDKYLEHSRIYLFGIGEREQIYIASADFMDRNLHRRIEVACPVLDPALQEELKTMLNYQLKDNTKARLLNDSRLNSYKTNNQPPFRSQNEIYDYFERLSLREEI